MIKSFVTTEDDSCFAIVIDEYRSGNPQLQYSVPYIFGTFLLSWYPAIHILVRIAPRAELSQLVESAESCFRVVAPKEQTITIAHTSYSRDFEEPHSLESRLHMVFIHFKLLSRREEAPPTLCDPSSRPCKQLLLMLEAVLRQLTSFICSWSYVPQYIVI